MSNLRGARSRKKRAADAALSGGELTLVSSSAPKTRGWVRVLISIVVISVLAGSAYALYAFFKPPSSFTSAVVQQRDLKRTITVTGEVRPAARIDLSFERGGTVESILAQVGDTVHAGDILAELKDKDVQFSYRSAQASMLAATANLQLALAGEKKEMIDIARQNVVKAQADVATAQTDLENATKQAANDSAQAELSLQRAQHELANTGFVLDASVTSAYDDMRIGLLSSISSMTTALTDGDQIIGVDDTATNQSYKYVLGAWNSASLDQARKSYGLATSAKQATEMAANSLGTEALRPQIDAAQKSGEQALLLIQAYLHDVQQVLATSIPGPGFSASDLTNAKARINADLVSVSSDLSKVVSNTQAKTKAVLTRDQTLQSLQDAVDAAHVALATAHTNAASRIRSAEAVVKSKKASLQSAQADLAFKEAPPRDVDLAPLRAAVSQTQAVFEQAKADLQKIRIVAPVQGTISEIFPDTGELVRNNETAIRMIGEEQFDIETLIPEADIAIANIGQNAVMTLDAYGAGRLFGGTVLSIEPDQTLLQDAVYYKAKLSIGPSEQVVRPGMTANVKITGVAAVQELIIPSDFLLTEPTNGSFVLKRSAKGGQERVWVKVIARGDAGMVAVQGDLNEGDTILKPQ